MKQLNQNTLQDIANKAKPKPRKLRNAIVAFISGGVIAVFAQGILELYKLWFDMDAKEAMTPMTITVIVIAILLTGFGVFDRIGQFCGAGAFIPITGFANSMASEAIESRHEGPVFGIGSNMFKLAGSVITYGIVSAYVVGLIRYFLDL